MIRRSLSLLLCAALMVSSLLGGCTRKVDPELVYGRESSSQSSSQSSSSQPPEPPVSSSSEPEPEPSSEPIVSSEPEPEPESEASSAYVPAMSADFAQLAGLSNENRGWVPAYRWMTATVPMVLPRSSRNLRSTELILLLPIPRRYI